jgi:hypothetical protein
LAKVIALWEPIERSHGPVKDRLRALRGQRSLRTGQDVLEAVEAAQAVRRGDQRRTPGRRRPETVVSASNRARAHSHTFHFAAEQLRRPGHPLATRWRPRPVVP